MTLSGEDDATVGGRVEAGDVVAFVAFLVAVAIMLVVLL